MYMDITFLSCHIGKTTLKLPMILQQHTSQPFIKEVEKKNAQLFMDILITNKTSRFQHIHYRKPAHTSNISAPITTQLNRILRTLYTGPVYKMVSHGHKSPEWLITYTTRRRKQGAVNNNTAIHEGTADQLKRY